LLLVHGRLNYRRISMLICYIFYKNALNCFTVLWFGIFSGFSGQNLFLDWAIQLYNVTMTSVPILVFAVMDRDLEPEFLWNNPKIYSLTKHGELFNFRVFWKWLCYGLIQSIIIFFFIVVTFGMSTSSSSNGQSDGLFSMGLVLYTVVVITTNLRIAAEIRSWTWIHHVAVWGSIIIFFLIMIIFSASTVFSTAGADYYYLMFRLFATPKFYLVVILCVGSALFIDFTVVGLEKLSAAPVLTRAASEKFEKKIAPARKAPKEAKQPNYSGFDFSYTPGEGTRAATRRISGSSTKSPNITNS